MATVILGVAVTGLLGALRASAANAARLAESQRAVALARRQMDELLAARDLPRGVPLEGLFPGAETGGMEAGWRAMVLPFEAMAAKPGEPPPPGTRILERIDLEIWWRHGETRRTWNVVTYRGGFLRPGEEQLFGRMQGGMAEGMQR